MCWISGDVNHAHIHIPKLLGIYERELHPYIERACALNLSHIINLGAAEGYYAVGMSLRNPGARIIAFESQAQERWGLTERARINGVVNRLGILGKCEPEDLKRVLADAPRPFIVCDVEGYESVLLDPAIVPLLQHSWILVELHEFVEQGITEKVRKRFERTHKISHVWQQERKLADFPFQDFYTRFLPKRYLCWAVSESRPERMSWFWMEPASAPGAQ